MLLTKDELERLVAAKHQSPHALLGMHPLGDGAGLVVRALLQNAAKVEAQPTHEPAQPTITLKRLHKAGLFEGVTMEANRVYAYDLVITDHRGHVRRTRDPYSFLPTLGESDLYLFNKGDERRVYDKLGAQLRTIDGVTGTNFAVWAPNAERVSVVGDFNGWDGRRHPMQQRSGGVWELFLPGLEEGAIYKYEVKGRYRGYLQQKSDPYAFASETPPKTASRVCRLDRYQ